MKYIDDIYIKYPEYSTDTDLVFDSCNIKYIVVLRKLPDTITNESRKGVDDPMYARFRGNKFTVVNIFLKLDPSCKKSQLINLFDHSEIYEVGKEISVGDFDNDLEKIYAKGITYYKSIKAAFSSDGGNIIFDTDYTGKMTVYHTDGSVLICKYSYKGTQVDEKEYYKKVYGCSFSVM